MATVLARSNGHHPPTPDRRARNDDRAAARDAARNMWRSSLAEGAPISGAELGRRFGLSDRWGRARVAEARDEFHEGLQEPPDEPDDDAPSATVVDPDQHGLTAAPAPNDDGEANQLPWQDTLITLVVACVAAAASYAHMFDLAHMAGEPLWVARAFPVTVDGLVLAALRRGEDGRRWLGLGLVVSVAANVVANFPGLAAEAGPVVSAVPPLTLYGTHRLLHGRPPRQ